MKNILFILILSSLYIKSSAQSCNWTDSIILNTGFDQNTNTLLPIGVVDPNWRLINLPIVTTANSSALLPARVAGITPLPALIALNQAYVINRWSTNWNNNNLANERPLSANNTAGFGLNNFDPNQPYRFVREFCVRNQDNINIDIFIKGDDAARLTLYDASNSPLVSYTTITGLNATTYILGDPRNFDNNAINGYNLNTSLLLPAGTYTVEVEMVASNSTAMGWTLSGGIRSISGTNSLSYSPNCCDVGTIGFVKYLDNNCNQEIDVDDDIHPNITFNLLQGTNIIATETTNPLTGELFFRNIPFGTYTIQEVGPNFSLANNPGNIVLNQNNNSHYFVLFNCPMPPIPPCCPEEKTLGLELETIGGPHNKNPGEGWANNEPLSFVESKIDISLPTSYANIPITEMRLSVVDMSFEDNIEACGDCIDNPANWAALSYENVPDTDDALPIGSAANGFLNGVTKINDGSNLPPATWYTFNKRYNTKELVWENPNGVLLAGGEEMKFLTFLPPFSEIPCCSKTVNICYKVTYKFADCTQCDVIICKDGGYVLHEDHLKKKN